MTTMFVEQPLAPPKSDKYTHIYTPNTHAPQYTYTYTDAIHIKKIKLKHPNTNTPETYTPHYQIRRGSPAGSRPFQMELYH